MSYLHAFHPQAVPQLTRPAKNLDLRSVRTHKWHILPCSAITGENLNEGLAWVVEDAKSRLFLY